MERVLALTLGSIHVDVYCSIPGESCVFQLKYKTRAVVVTIGTEIFSLQDHVAQPLGRYDVLKDLVRVEAIVNESHASCGYVIFLTNDSAYWCDSRNVAGTSDAFSLRDGRIIDGELKWSATTSTGTKRKRGQAIKLAAKYPLHWQDYSRVAVHSYPQFRYLILKARPASVHS